MLTKVKDTFGIPYRRVQRLAVSSAMVKARGKQCWFDEERVAMEILTLLRQSRSDFIITYFAKDACANWLKNSGRIKRNSRILRAKGCL